MASVDDFLHALDSIEQEIRQVPDVVFVEMSLTRGRMSGDKGNAIDVNGRYFMLLASRSILAHWDESCFDIGGPEFPFVWSLKRSAVNESFSKELESEQKSVEFAVWYYLDSWKNPVPEHWLCKFPQDELDHIGEDGLAAMVYRADMEQAINVIRAVNKAWSLAPEAVIRKFGDLSKISIGPALPAGVNDNFYLWWPAVLLYLALKKVDSVLSACAAEYIPYDSIFDDLPEGVDHQACIDAFSPTTWTVALRPPSLLAATRCALRAFRRAAEDSIENLDEPKFEWRPAMLEGWVIALLKEVEYPTQRYAVEWISRKSRLPAPSTSTLLKTYCWQKRPQRTSKPRTTNEAQSGVSVSHEADPAVSHEDVIDEVLGIEEKLHRQLTDDERTAVAWTLQQAGVCETERKRVIGQLAKGFRDAGL